MTAAIRSDSSGTYGALQVGGADSFRFGSDTSGQLASFRNILINAGLRINQRGYVSAAVLAAGSYGHDRFKAGASGGDYSFTQLNSNTTITIAASKSLIQVVEDKNVVGGSYVLSWTGTAQARVGLNSATPSGSYAASPILITGQTAGTTMSVEFNTGTLAKAQLESGSIATTFEQRPIGTELALCQRYLPAFNSSGTSSFIGNGYCITTTSGVVSYVFKTTARVAPTGLTTTAASNFEVMAGASGGITATALSFAYASTEGAVINTTVASGQTTNSGAILRALNSSAQLLFTGCEL